MDSVQNQHRVFGDLVSPDFGDITVMTHRAAALLLHEYLSRAVRKSDWVTDLLYSTGELPEMPNIFSCEGSARDCVGNYGRPRGSTIKV